jgi:hypothetical protein
MRKAQVYREAADPANKKRDFMARTTRKLMHLSLGFFEV